MYFYWVKCADNIEFHFTNTDKCIMYRFCSSSFLFFFNQEGRFASGTKFFPTDRWISVGWLTSSTESYNPNSSLCSRQFDKVMTSLYWYLQVFCLKNTLLRSFSPADFQSVLRNFNHFHTHGYIRCITVCTTASSSSLVYIYFIIISNLIVTHVFYYVTHANSCKHCMFQWCPECFFFLWFFYMWINNNQ